MHQIEKETKYVDICDYDFKLYSCKFGHYTSSGRKEYKHGVHGTSKLVCTMLHYECSINMRAVYEFLASDKMCDL